MFTSDQLQSIITHYHNGNINEMNQILRHTACVASATSGAVTNNMYNHMHNNTIQQSAQSSLMVRFGYSILLIFCSVLARVLFVYYTIANLSCI